MTVGQKLGSGSLVDNEGTKMAAESGGTYLDTYRHWHDYKYVDLSAVPIPHALRLRPRVDGIAVAYTQRVGGNLLEMSEAPRRFAIANNICGMCGHKLVGPVAFLGTAAEFASSEFRQPGCHPACAYYLALALDSLHPDHGLKQIVLAQKQHARSVGTPESGIAIFAVAKNYLAVDRSIFIDRHFRT